MASGSRAISRICRAIHIPREAPMRYGCEYELTMPDDCQNLPMVETIGKRQENG